MEILISAIIPVYNSEKYLEDCIRSLMNQTLKNIEMIFINDGSTDSSLEILKKFERMDKRIRVINQKNSGPSCARNNGIKVSRGKYISFIDADDWIDSDMYENMYNEASNYSAELVICDCWEIETEKIYRKMLNENTNKYHNNNLKEIIIEMLLNNSSINPLWNKLFKKDIINKNNFRLDESIFYAEDWLFVFNYCMKIEKIRYIKEPYYNYRRGHESLSNSYGEETFEKTGLWIYRKRKEFAKEFNYDIHSGSNELLQVLINCIISEGLRVDKGINQKIESIRRLIEYKEINEAIKNREDISLNIKQKIILSFVKYKLSYCLFLYSKLAGIKSFIKSKLINNVLISG